MRTHLALLLTILLVVGAGCIGTVPRDTASAAMAPDNSTATTTTANGTTTSPNETTTQNGTTTTAGSSNDTTGPSNDTTSTPGANDSASTPETAPEGVSSDAERIAATHVSALREAGSFTRRTAVSVEAAGANGTWGASEMLDAGAAFPTRMAVNLDRGRLLTNADGGNASATDYVSFDDGMAYRSHGGTGAEAGYRAVPLSECALPATEGALLDRLELSLAHRLGGATFEEAGTETYQGMEVTRLVAENASTGDDATVTNTKLVVLVGPDGAVRRFEVERSFGASGMVLRHSVVVTYADLGRTTVEEPAWVEEARNRSAG